MSMEQKPLSPEAIAEPVLDKTSKQRLRIIVKNLLASFENQVLRECRLFNNDRRRSIHELCEQELLKVSFLLGQVNSSAFHSKLVQRLVDLEMAADRRAAAIQVERKRNLRRAAEADKYYEARSRAAHSALKHLTDTVASLKAAYMDPVVVERLMRKHGHKIRTGYVR